MDIKNKTKVYEIPYPFKYTYHKNQNHVILDYTFETLCNDKTETLQLVNDMIEDKHNRFTNTNIIISCVDITTTSH